MPRLEGKRSNNGLYIVLLLVLVVVVVVLLEYSGATNVIPNFGAA